MITLLLALLLQFSLNKNTIGMSHEAYEAQNINTFCGKEADKIICSDDEDKIFGHTAYSTAEFTDNKLLYLAYTMPQGKKTAMLIKAQLTKLYGNQVNYDYSDVMDSFDTQWDVAGVTLELTFSTKADNSLGHDNIRISIKQDTN